MKSLIVLMLSSQTLAHKLLRGDCTSSGQNCISPLSLDAPEKLNPATIVTSTNSDGFVTAQAISGDMPNAGPDTSYNGETEEDIALRFTIQSPTLDPPPSAPPLITCDYESCTTSTTTASA